MRIWYCGVLAGLLLCAGCSMLSDQDGKLDVESARGLVGALGDAGFTGEFVLDVNGEVEGLWVTGIRGGSPGSSLHIAGSIRPTGTPAIQPP